MLNKFKLLIVEDDVSVVQTYERSVRLFNHQQNISTEEIKYEFSIDVAINKSEAIDKINNIENSFDGAIIDLDLEGRGGEDSSGLEVIKHIKDNERFPVFINSGTTHQLSDEDDIAQNDLYKIFIRGEDEFNFIEEFLKIHSTGITDILNRTGKIEEFINTIYWKHLSTSLLPWIEDSVRTEEDKKQSLIRYCIMHLQEYLDISTVENNSFSDYFPAEFFITGPIKPNLFTGDIIECGSQLFVVMTPACDLGNFKAERVLCLEVNPLNNIDSKFDNDPMSKNEKGILKKYLENKNDRYHFIPSLYFKRKKYEAGLLDFQNQTSLSFEEITDDIKFERIATISQPFLKDLIARYSRYYTRQGAPNISSKQLESIYLR